MPGTRTSSDVTAAAIAKRVSASWVDASGDGWSESYLVPVAATNAQIEALLDALQAASNSSLYGTEIASIYDGEKDPQNALIEQDKSVSVFDRLAQTYKNSNPMFANKRVSIPAPIQGLFVSDGATTTLDDIDPTSAELVAVVTAALAMFGAGWSAAWARYTEHVETNNKTLL